MSYVILLYSQQGNLYKVISRSIFEKTPSSLNWKEYHQYIHKYDWLYEMWNMLREVLTPYIFFLPRYWNTFLPLWLIECNIAALTNMIFEICSCRILDINNDTILITSNNSRYSKRIISINMHIKYYTSMSFHLIQFSFCRR